MKYIKYITMVLLVGLFAACSDKDVTYDMDKANDATKAYIQLFNMAPIANNAANYAYAIDINGYEYVNDCAAVLQTRNGFPGGGTNLFMTVDAGTLNIKLYKKENVTYERDANGLFYVTFTRETVRVNPGDTIYFVESDGVVVGGTKRMSWARLCATRTRTHSSASSRNPTMWVRQQSRPASAIRW